MEKDSHLPKFVAFFSNLNNTVITKLTLLFNKCLSIKCFICNFLTLLLFVTSKNGKWENSSNNFVGELTQ